MNKKQWYALGIMFLILAIWFFIMGVVMQSNIAYNLIGTPCIIVAFACWVCSWLEIGDTI